ncbi:MAG: hypothetical protein JXR76_24275 [Deltaproteobacteria bacterium]|nr:hypothetical protein [Deltaproteobacteria bacterium]
MRPFKYVKLISLICAAVFFTNGCLGDTDGIDPPDDQFVFPVALSTVHDDSHLLVVNSNFDLRYNAGTLVAYSLDKLDSVAGAPLSYNPGNGTFSLPPGVGLKRFCSGGRTTQYCNLNPSEGIIKNETIRLGAYASTIDITPDKDRALIPVRGERAIVVVDLNDGADVMDCGEKKSDDQHCDSAHMITDNSIATMPKEPYDVKTMNYFYDDQMVTLGFASHRDRGEVSLFSVSGQRSVGNNNLIKVIGGVIQGASGLAVNPHNQDILLVGQRDTAPHVAVLDVQTDLRDDGSYYSDPSFGQSKTINLSTDYNLGYGAALRDVTVSPDGKTGFVISQRPPMLLKLDLERYEVTDSITICREAAKVKTYVDEGDPENQLDDKLYAYVACFLTGQVYIVDADYMVPVIRKTGVGSQDIAFDAKRKIAYIANFSESTISMIQTEAPFNLVYVKNNGATDDQALILRIGVPNSAEGN